MNNLFFWIIVLSFLIPMGMRLYKKSVRGRNQNQGGPGGFPGQFGQFPGNSSGGAPGDYPGPQSKQPRDGLTQSDYYGGFGQLGAPQQPQPPANQQYPGQPNSPRQYPGEQFHGEQYPNPAGDQQPAAVQQPSGPAVPPPPSAPQGFRARKLAELDQRYSNGEIAMEDYMAQRAEIMKG
ncbi:hypothetical protein ACX80S_14800 [Arthrobacter sp. RHLT1-20]